MSTSMGNSKPPEGWERTEANDDEGMWNPLTGDVYPPDGIHYRCLGITLSKYVCECFGFVPVRKTKPAVPEWAVNLAEMWPNGMTTEQRAQYFAENFASKADADEMLRMLKKYLPISTNLVPELVALIERMEGKR